MKFRMALVTTLLFSPLSFAVDVNSASQAELEKFILKQYDIEVRVQDRPRQKPDELEYNDALRKFIQIAESKGLGHRAFPGARTPFEVALNKDGSLDWLSAEGWCGDIDKPAAGIGKIHGLVVKIETEYRLRDSVAGQKAILVDQSKRLAIELEMAALEARNIVISNSDMSFCDNLYKAVTSSAIKPEEYERYLTEVLKAVKAKPEGSYSKPTAIEVEKTWMLFADPEVTERIEEARKTLAAIPVGERENYIRAHAPERDRSYLEKLNKAM